MEPESTEAGGTDDTEAETMEVGDRIRDGEGKQRYREDTETAAEREGKAEDDRLRP